MRILVLGAYGLIGSSVVRHLLDAGHEVVGLGRSVDRARRMRPDVRWITGDLSRLTTAETWQPILRDAAPGAVVNCAGALQDSARDDVVAVHARSIAALIAAMAELAVTKLVQISAPRAHVGSDTRFMRSKGEADAAIAASALDWTILRPGLVLAPEAYGGSAVLRALAAVPLVQPLAFADAAVQTVAVGDVAGAVLAVLAGRVPSRRTYDLVEDEAHSLAHVVAALRGWLGYPPAPVIVVPRFLIRGVGRIADGFGWLGWRAPLRTTALTELAAGVTGDPAPWRAATGQSLSSLTTTLRQLSSTVQERWFARLFFVKPAAIGMLAAFWLVTGIVALARFESAKVVLASHGVGDSLATAIVGGGALVDIALAAGILLHRRVRAAGLGMIAVTLAYVVGGSIVAPELWLDPLGPLVKPLPAAILALVVLALVEER